MDFEKIEAAYQLLLENTQLIQNQLKTSIYEAIIEQNAYYLGAEGADKEVASNQAKLRELHLTKEEWRRAYQFLLLKANQTEPLQTNHQPTPDLFGFIFLFLLETLTNRPGLDVLELGSGTGSLAFTLLANQQKTLVYTGIEVDDLLIDLSASMAEVMGLSATFMQEDGVRPLVLPEFDVVLGDLPVGYYPNDEVAGRYQVVAQTEHTYAHHLLMEQGLKYLRKDGLAIFLAPADLLTSPQSDLLKTWLQEKADLLALIGLPETLFGSEKHAKTIFVLQKKQAKSPETFVYALSDLSQPENLMTFMENFKKWKRDSDI